MSKSQKDAESLHADQHELQRWGRVKNDKAGDNSYNKPAKMVLENLETSSARKHDKRHKSRKGKINSLSSSPEMKRRRNKTKKETKKRRIKSRSRWEKRKRPPSSSLSSSSSSSSPREKNSNAISHRAWKITRTFILKIIFLIKTLTKRYWRKIQSHEIYKRYPYWMILWKHCWFPKRLSRLITKCKFQEKILQAIGPLSRLWKGLEDIRNDSYEAVEVPVDTFATLIEPHICWAKHHYQSRIHVA